MKTTRLDSHVDEIPFDSLVDWLHGSWTFVFGRCHVFNMMTN